MTGNWKAELRNLKQQFNEETMKAQKKATSSSDSNESELKKLRKLLESLLLPVVEVFNEEGLTKTLQPHIHQHKNGYTLVVPVAEPGVKPIILRLELELLHTKNGYAMKVIHDTPKSIPAAEKVMEHIMCSEERIREEIRAFLIERQNLILNIKKRAK
jgi:hypothetical protein